MNKLPDIDIDFANRDLILNKVKHIPATLKDGKKHNTGAYFIDIPVDPMSGQASIDHEIAEDRGYFKVDFLNVNVYNGIKNEEHDGFVFFVSSSSRATNISSRNNSEAKTNREE